MFLPESIDLAHPDRYVLSIRIKPNGFMFSISEPGNGKCYCLRETTFLANDDLLNNIQRIVFELSFLTLEFKQTNVVFVSANYDLVPDSFFSPKYKDDLYNYTHSNKAEYLLSKPVERQDVTMLFDPGKNIYEFLLRNLWDPQFHNHTNLLISLFEEKGKAMDTASKMYVNFHDDFMDIICFAGSKLIHCSSYENEAAANQLYYILKLWEKSGFNQLEDYIYIAGNPDELITNHLQEYIKKIEQMNAPSEIHFWNEDAQKAPLDLLTLSL